MTDEERERKKLQNKRYREANKDVIRQKNAEYYRKHKEQIKRKHREYARKKYGFKPRLQDDEFEETKFCYCDEVPAQADCAHLEDGFCRILRGTPEGVCSFYKKGARK